MADDFFDDLERRSRDATDSIRGLGDAAAQSVRSVQGLTTGFQRISAAIGAIGYLAPGPLGKAAMGLGAAGVFAGATAASGAGLAGAASPNGLDSVNKAFEVLSGTIGTMLLPGFVALGGVALVAADSVQAFIRENKAEIIKTWTDAIVASVDAVKNFTEWLNKPFADKAKDVLPEGIRGPLREHGFIRDKREGISPFANAELWEQVKKGQPVAPPWAANAGQQPGAVAGPFLGKLADAMDKIAKDMQTSLGTTGMTDPASRWKEVAIALQKSDLELRKLTMFQEAMQLVRDFIGELRKQAAPQPAVVGGGWWN